MSVVPLACQMAKTGELRLDEKIGTEMANWNSILHSRLNENAERFGFSDFTPALDWIQNSFEDRMVTRFMTVTYRRPQTNIVKLQQMNRTLRNRLYRCLYRGAQVSAANFKILFINERYSRQITSQPDYHLHVVMSEPLGSPRQNEFFIGTWEEHTDSLICNCARGFRASWESLSEKRVEKLLENHPVANVHIKKIDDPKGVIAYMLKTLSAPRTESLEIDYLNSTAFRSVGKIIV